ncbi:hypothetical protein [Duganella sp. LjRoot269]|jgi:hypothetical protein|uniref:hypothetical protein n=1 Tax=Duganella sp. LjRoot269 TaxID=3342305 RepID=UPI003ED0A915
MSSNDNGSHIENAPRGAYDARVDTRLGVIETRIAAIEADQAAIRKSLATVRTKAELQTAMTNRNAELQKALMIHRRRLYGVASLVMGGVYLIARYGP